MTDPAAPAPASPPAQAAALVPPPPAAPPAGAPAPVAPPSPAFAAVGPPPAVRSGFRAPAWLGLDSGGWRGTIVFAAALATLVFGTQAINAAIPARGANDGGQDTGVAVSDRVTIHPASGWTVGGRFTDMPGLQFQKGDVAFDVRVTTFTDGGAGKLLASYLKQFIVPQATQLDITTTKETTVGRQYRAYRATYVALFKELSGPTDGQVTGLVFKDGLAIVFDAWAPQGSLTNALGDVQDMIDTVEIGQ